MANTLAHDLPEWIQMFTDYFAKKFVGKDLIQEILGKFQSIGFFLWVNPFFVAGSSLAILCASSVHWGVK